MFKMNFPTCKHEYPNFLFSRGRGNLHLVTIFFVRSRKEFRMRETPVTKMWQIITKNHSKISCISYIFLFISLVVYHVNEHEMLFILFWWKLLLGCHFFVAFRVENVTTKLTHHLLSHSHCLQVAFACDLTSTLITLSNAKLPKVYIWFC